MIHYYKPIPRLLASASRVTRPRPDSQDGGRAMQTHAKRNGTVI